MIRAFFVDVAQGLALGLAIGAVLLFAGCQNEPGRSERIDGLRYREWCEAICGGAGCRVQRIEVKEACIGACSTCYCEPIR